MKLIPDYKNTVLLEPFAGANNIVNMIKDLGFDNDWRCFDISPSENNVAKQYPIEKRDTILNFPEGFSVGITNPPYLAKNSATRANLDFPDTIYDDLYKVALDVMLNNLDYVAAIIPESFINSGLFHQRLFAFVSLTCKMFEDTDCPVCLALFIPVEKKIEYELEESDFLVYRQNKKIGKYKTLAKERPSSTLNLGWTFNDKDGAIGIRCIDGTTCPSIQFVDGDDISADKIKVSSRSLTRVSGLPADIDTQEFLTRCNERLTQYRQDTYDIFLTSFKGLRKDGQYRRRLDFANAKTIMNEIVETMRRERAHDCIIA